MLLDVCVIGSVGLDFLSGNPCLVQVGLVLNDGLVLAVPACQYITTCSSVGGGPAEAMPPLAAEAGAWSGWSAPEASRSARRLAASIATHWVILSESHQKSQNAAPRLPADVLNGWAAWI